MNFWVVTVRVTVVGDPLTTWVVTVLVRLGLEAVAGFLFPADFYIRCSSYAFSIDFSFIC